jgi:hypothetical protein
VEIYNNQIHSITKVAPEKAYENPKLLMQVKEKEKEKKEEKDEKPKKLKPRYKIGDFVRISRIKGVFEKGYEINWTPEVFVITQIHFSDPITYNLNDLMGEEVDGSFYEQELHLTKLKDFSLVEKVLKKRKVKGKEQKYVKFFGLPSKFNQWLNAEDVADINPVN